jgi:transcriptional regulator with XRE-family HTH domain
MTPDHLAAIGRALYGARWQSDMADALGVDRRTIRRWMAGQNPVPAAADAEMRRLLERRGAEIGRLLAA